MGFFRVGQLTLPVAAEVLVFGSISLGDSLKPSILVSFDEDPLTGGVYEAI